VEVTHRGIPHADLSWCQRCSRLIGRQLSTFGMCCHTSVVETVMVFEGDGLVIPSFCRPWVYRSTYF
jgi:hypothetical protein